MQRLPARRLYRLTSYLPPGHIVEATLPAWLTGEQQSQQGKSEYCRQYKTEQLQWPTLVREPREHCAVIATLSRDHQEWSLYLAHIPTVQYIIRYYIRGLTLLPVPC